MLAQRWAVWSIQKNNYKLYATVSRCNTLVYVSKGIHAHDDAAGTSELSDLVAPSQQGEDMHASSVVEIHWPFGASMRHLRSMQNDSVAVCLLQRCVWGGGLTIGM